MPFLSKLLNGVFVFILKDALRYRVQVIRGNLKAAFPNISEEQLRTKVNAYYRFLASTIVQIIGRPTRRKLNKHLIMKDLPAIHEWLDEKRSIIIMMAHIGNWEWTGHYISHHYPGSVIALYKKIKSPWVEKWMHHRRSASGAELLEIEKTQMLIRKVREGSKMILMIADQNPGRDQGIIWLPFLGLDTAFIGGPESLALKYRLPVVYAWTIPHGTGYKIDLVILYDGNTPIEEGEITKRYASALEKNILQFPEGWLWSHRRWKRKRKAGLSE